MRAVLLTSLLAFVALSGCFGLPEGSADFGDDVEIAYTAVDPETGAILLSRLDNVPTYEEGGITFYSAQQLSQAFAQATGDQAFVARFVQADEVGVEKLAFDMAVVEAGHLDALAQTAAFTIGSGASGFGNDFESALVGRAMNETFAYDSSGISNPIEVPAHLLSQAKTESLPRAEFEGQIGAPEVGMTFAWNSLLNATVDSFDNDTVVVTLGPNDVNAADAAAVGSKVIRVDAGNTFDFELQPVAGETFTIRPDFSGNTLLNLPAGAFRSVGRDGDMATFVHFPGFNPELIGAPLMFHIEVTSVTGNEAPFDPDNYGVRDSPVVLPSMPHEHNAMPADDHHDDGHDHTH